MKEKAKTKEQEQPVAEKRTYSPPSLTVYGKLSELTAGGLSGKKESDMGKRVG